MSKSLARMDFTIKLCFITIMAIKLVLVNCYSSGAHVESCETLSPNSSYHGAVQQTSSVPFEIDTNMFKNPFSDELHYNPNSSYWSKPKPSVISKFKVYIISHLQSPSDQNDAP